jgi:hypothetical protein
VNCDFRDRSVAQGWDALHLYIANNLDWMKVWIDRCKEHHGGILSWKELSELVGEARHNGYYDVKQREIDLAYCLKDGKERKFTHFIQLFYIILM